MILLLTLQFLSFFKLASSTISSGINGYKIVVNPSDLQQTGILNATYRSMSIIQCSSIVYNNSTFWSMFCILPDGSCMVSNASYPAHYNNAEFEQSDYNCYTTEPPVIYPGRSHIEILLLIWTSSLMIIHVFFIFNNKNKMFSVFCSYYTIV